MEFKSRCVHEWKENTDGTRLICNLCKKEKLKKIKINDNIYYGTKIDGKKYTIRRNRNEYFLPEDWLKFYNTLIDDTHKLLFDFLIKTGARIDEALHFKKTDLVDDSRKIIRLMVTKRKAKVEGEGEDGKVRSLKIDSSLYNKLKKSKSLYVFIDINEEKKLEETKKITSFKAINYRELLKRKLKKVKLDPTKYALHNIRKTNGDWLKALGKSESEICLRLGHDGNTFRKHYGSPDIYSSKDKQLMLKILGDIF